MPASSPRPWWWAEKPADSSKSFVVSRIHSSSDQPDYSARMAQIHCTTVAPAPHWGQWIR
ncbi:MAG: hypothetical protein JWO52_1833 [Gammaproteobacteria bacterium]|jgi:hypothetical protein|nr:hypothetical protein [Gammaproteobacteria bacterium]